eukprot:jgi/Galph1/590/GphlegSOOS_G5360.1
MTRKQKKSDKKRGGTDDASSVHSEETATSSLSTEIQKLNINSEIRNFVMEEEELPLDDVGAFTSAVERLNDKRSWLRMKALQYAYSTLCKTYRPDLLEDNVETLVYSVLKGSLQYNVREEKQYVCLLLATVVLTLGESDQSEYIWAQCEASFKKILNDGVQDCFEAIAVVGLVGLLELEDIKSIMKVCTKYFVSSNSSLAAQAIRAWSILASSLPVEELKHCLFADPKPVELFYCIFSPCAAWMDERSLATAQTLSLLLEIFPPGEASSASSDNDSEELQAWNRDSSKGNGHIKKMQLRNTLELVQQLNSCLSKGVEIFMEENKRTPKKQRKLRKSLIHALEGDVEAEHFQLSNGDEILFDSWLDILRLNMFRFILGSGLKSHLESNSFIRQVLSLGLPVSVPSKALQFTKEEKRIYRSPNSVFEKKRTVERQRRRARRIHETDATVLSRTTK